MRVAPRTAYGVARVEQEFGPPGSTVGVDGDHRQPPVRAGDPLAALLTRNAFTFSGDSVLRFGDYEMQGYLGVTHVDGEPGAILRLQRSSARYLPASRRRLRAGSIRRARRLSGAKGGISIERQNGRHWLWQAATSFETPGFETNDIGRLTTGDGVLVNAELEYQETTPGRWFRDMT